MTPPSSESETSVEEDDMSTRVWREDVERLLKVEHAQLIEVLPDTEYEEQHIAGAINIPLNKLNRESTAGLSKELPVIVY